MPGPGSSIHERIGFHNRPGTHDVKDVDWDNYIAFANKWWAIPSTDDSRMPTQVFQH